MAVISRVYCVYIVTNDRGTVLYTGVTNDLERRIGEHRERRVEGFTKRYNTSKLVYYEAFEDISTAIEREKQIKGYSRDRKRQLIEMLNPGWIDLYEQIRFSE